ncbi:MAG: hypothetical protein EXR31_01880 [Betaproteobacteria bacterium]|nr:hypothetical protein [Betaproteobacteria bacterium]
MRVQLPEEWAEELLELLGLPALPGLPLRDVSDETCVPFGRVTESMAFGLGLGVPFVLRLPKCEGP